MAFVSFSSYRHFLLYRCSFDKTEVVSWFFLIASTSKKIYLICVLIVVILFISFFKNDTVFFVLNFFSRNRLLGRQICYFWCFRECFFTTFTRFFVVVEVEDICTSVPQNNSVFRYFVFFRMQVTRQNYVLFYYEVDVTSTKSRYTNWYLCRFFRYWFDIVFLFTAFFKR